MGLQDHPGPLGGNNIKALAVIPVGMSGVFLKSFRRSTRTPVPKGMKVRVMPIKPGAVL
jgi:hypothetical protein